MSKLKNLLIEAHKEASHRENASTQVLKAAFISNGGNLIGSITAAMNMLGGLHAPIKQTVQWIERIPIGGLGIAVKSSPQRSTQGRVPGWGSGFIKGEFDPMLMKLHDELIKHHEVYAKIEESVTCYFASQGKLIFPNLAFYTAVTSIVEKIHIDLCESLILEARIPEWIKILKQQT
jgi:citrate synthase